MPQPSSMKTFAQLAQSCRTGVFAKYDYGNPATNLEHYGVPEAPIYDLQKIPNTFPLLICSGGKDQLASPADVITDDGYVLRMHRFPEGRINYPGRRNKPPVYLQHGILVDAANWFTVSHADQALPLILVEAGFDVWLGNTRGTRYSRKHVSENISSSDDYWDFTVSEMGKYDLPAFIDFVNQHTGQKVHFIGHSLGTTQFFAAFSEWKVEEKVKTATLLSPIAFLNHIRAHFVVISAKAYIGEIAGTFGIPFVDLKVQPLSAITYAFCNVPGINCWEVFSKFSGPNCCMNASTVNLYLHNWPEAASIKTLTHLSQNIRTGIFSKYDYGNPATNREHYGVPEAPVYDIQTSIPKDFPLLFCHGGLDALADPKDVQRTLSILRSHRNIHEIYVDNYAHYDFINAMTAKDVLYPDVVNFIKAHD
ncbi:triacylglycerol lipase 2-like isoform X2 [Apium graveolens]|uniref:triacylglycerol lipase 2-like isoform X2 n=1 Tax=Apium graveolens TaxID=4045 RepID=UPI003D793A12